MQNGEGGILVSPQTGEQAFSVNVDEGTMKVYMGASTTSGPIRNVGLTFRSKTDVDHETAWYLEPFHGTYHHSIVLVPFHGNWKEAHVPRTMENLTAPVYQRECWAKGGERCDYVRSLAECGNVNCEVTMMEITDGKLHYRINEREGRATTCTLKVDGKTYKDKVLPFGIAGN